MANKVLVGVGIGCASLVVLGIVGVVGAGYWVKSKVGGMAEAGKAAVAQKQKVAELDQKYPFDAPASGPLQLDEKRLQEYLAVRDAIVPVYKSFEAKAKDFEKEHKGEKHNLGAGFEAVGMVGQFFTEVRDRWYQELDQHHMSPREFASITGTVYASEMGKTMAAAQKQMRPNLEQAISQMEKARAQPNLPVESQKALDVQLASMHKQLDALPPAGQESADAKVFEANAAMLEHYKVQLENDKYAGLDVFLLSDERSGTGFENAFRPLNRVAPPAN